MRLNKTPTPDPFPAWSWIGPTETDQTRPATKTAATEWPSLPALSGARDHQRARPAIRPTSEPQTFEDHELPWPDLPDDTPLWTIPATGYSAEHLARLDREQAG
jgi:hypothetical protein